MDKEIRIPIGVAKELTDIMCRAYNLALALDTQVAILAAETEFQPSRHTKQLGAMRDYLKQSLERAGVMW